MSDCSTYPTLVVAQRDEKIRKLEEKIKDLERVIDSKRKNYKRGSWEHYCDKPEDFADGGF